MCAARCSGDMAFQRFFAAWLILWRTLSAAVNFAAFILRIVSASASGSLCQRFRLFRSPMGVDFCPSRDLWAIQAARKRVLLFSLLAVYQGIVFDRALAFWIAGNNPAHPICKDWSKLSGPLYR